MKTKTLSLFVILLAVCAACSPRLVDDQTRSLSSLRQVDDYPLYTMEFRGAYLPGSALEQDAVPTHRWACALFAALGDPDSSLYGRNFDWEYSPALLLFTYPEDGYASVSVVDLAYLVAEDDVARLDELPVEQRRPLLEAPQLPFDGMNEHGLAIGMAAVPSAEVPDEPGMPTIDNLIVMREVLDHTRTVDEAVAILSKYRIEWGGGPPLHYLVADRSGRAALVEFVEGEIQVLSNDQPWHLATNFTVAELGTGAGNCPRYDRLAQRLRSSQGVLTPPEGLELLSRVSQEITQWSVVYDLSRSQVHIVMGKQYDRVHTFTLGSSQDK